ncbi:MAG: hypothetical protein JST00_36920 [Deltaproteobacteria bacterium]|nr:hypothetical protein [Deltaproteobacteria bacterium]
MPPPVFLRTPNQRAPVRCKNARFFPLGAKTRKPYPKRHVGSTPSGFGRGQTSGFTSMARVPSVA